MPLARATKIDDGRERDHAQRGTEPNKCQHQLAEHGVAIGRHADNILAFCRFSNITAVAIFELFALTLHAASPTWTVQTAGSPVGPWTNAVSGTAPQLFARLAVSNAAGATVGIGGVVTIPSSGQATFSNATLTVTAAIASNSLKQIEAMSSTNLALKLNLVGQ